MEMDDRHRAETGAFYTPKKWADKAVEYLLGIVPCLDGMVVYDPAAGEGALLDALPCGTDCVGSTLESSDTETLLRKGYTAFQFDFLHGNMRFIDDSVLEASRGGRLIVLTNPPYRKLRNGECELMKRVYPECCGDATGLFLLRIMRELKPLLTCAFTKMDVYQGAGMKQFRDAFRPFERNLGMFVCPSHSWPHLKGNFPIAFSVFAG